MFGSSFNAKTDISVKKTSEVWYRELKELPKFEWKVLWTFTSCSTRYVRTAWCTWGDMHGKTWDVSVSPISWAKIDFLVYTRTSLPIYICVCCIKKWSRFFTSFHTTYAHGCNIHLSLLANYLRYRIRYQIPAIFFGPYKSKYTKI